MINDGNMDRSLMMFTSDVSLPKDDKTAMWGKRITAGQLTELCAQTNANYAARKVDVQSMGGTPGQVDRNPSASTTNHPPWDIYPEHLAGIKLRVPPIV